MSPSQATCRPLAAHRHGALRGVARAPGDKSISHRAVMIGGLAVGETAIEGLLEGEDVLRTAAALRLLGAEASRDDDGTWRVFGRGVGGLAEPADVIDMGNSGTGARLLLGILAGHPFTAVLTGDASLRRRPMARVTEPLGRMGAAFTGRAGGRLPLAVTGPVDLLPISYNLPIASAQIKSAILLAGLHAPGRTTVVEPAATRDHTELMLAHFGARVEVDETADGGRVVTIDGQPELTGRPVRVPADPSSAAFLAVAALITPESEVRLPGVGLNPTRGGLYKVLTEMGGAVAVENHRHEAGEPIGDLVVRGSELKGVAVPADIAPTMIDEYPILAVAAACATGTTSLRGLAELRVKESDRLDAMARGLAACGVTLEAGDDWLEIHGTGHPPAGGATIATDLDHRIAMSFLVLGGVTSAPVAIDDGRPIDTSFPGFVDLMNGLGARIGAAEGII